MRSLIEYRHKKGISSKYHEMIPWITKYLHLSVEPTTIAILLLLMKNVTKENEIKLNRNIRVQKGGQNENLGT